LTLQRACGSGAAAGESAVACAAAAEENGTGLELWFESGPGLWLVFWVAGLWLGLSPGATIGAPIFAFGCAGAEGAIGFAMSVGTAASGGLVDALAFALGVTGGGTALSPALVSTMGDIGADSQSSPKSTLPSAIASTAP